MYLEPVIVIAVVVVTVVVVTVVTITVVVALFRCQVFEKLSTINRPEYSPIYCYIQLIFPFQSNLLSIG